MSAAAAGVKVAIIRRAPPPRAGAWPAYLHRAMPILVKGSRGMALETFCDALADQRRTATQACRRLALIRPAEGTRTVLFDIYKWMHASGLFGDSPSACRPGGDAQFRAGSAGGHHGDPLADAASRWATDLNFTTFPSNELQKNKKTRPPWAASSSSGPSLSPACCSRTWEHSYVRMGLFCMLYLAVLGRIDDWLKLTAARRSPAAATVSGLGKTGVSDRSWRGPGVFIYKHRPTRRWHTLLNWPLSGI